MFLRLKSFSQGQSKLCTRFSCLIYAEEDKLLEKRKLFSQQSLCISKKHYFAKKIRQFKMFVKLQNRAIYLRNSNMG